MAKLKSTRQPAVSSVPDPESAIPQVLRDHLAEQQTRAYELQGLLELLDKAITADEGLLAIGARMALDLNIPRDSATIGRVIRVEVSHG